MKHLRRDSWRPTEAELREMAAQFFINWAHLADIATNLGRIANVLEKMSAEK